MSMQGDNLFHGVFRELATQKIGSINARNATSLTLELFKILGTTIYNMKASFMLDINVLS